MKKWFKTTRQFDAWMDSLGSTTRIRIDARMQRARGAELFGDHKGVGGEVSEMRLDFGPGYRL